MTPSCPPPTKIWNENHALWPIVCYPMSTRLSISLQYFWTFFTGDSSFHRKSYWNSGFLNKNIIYFECLKTWNRANTLIQVWAPQVQLSNPTSLPGCDRHGCLQCQTARGTGGNCSKSKIVCQDDSKCVYLGYNPDVKFPLELERCFMCELWCDFLPKLLEIWDMSA